MTHPDQEAQRAALANMIPPAAFPGSRSGDEVKLPQRGSFAISEVAPMIPEWAKRMEDARKEWSDARFEAVEKKAAAKQARANVMTTLRIFGNAANGNVGMKTNVEREMWADAEPSVQQAELDADLAQTAQMVAKEAYEEVTKIFDLLQSLLGVERDDLRRTYNQAGNGPHA